MTDAVSSSCATVFDNVFGTNHTLSSVPAYVNTRISSLTLQRGDGIADSPFTKGSFTFSLVLDASALALLSEMVAPDGVPGDDLFGPTTIETPPYHAFDGICVFFDDDAWSDRECTMLGFNLTLATVTCRCNHLSDFSVVLTQAPPQFVESTPQDARIMVGIIVIGSCILVGEIAGSLVIWRIYIIPTARATGSPKAPRGDEAADATSPAAVTRSGTVPRLPKHLSLLGITTLPDGAAPLDGEPAPRPTPDEEMLASPTPEVVPAGVNRNLTTRRQKRAERRARITEEQSRPDYVATFVPSATAPLAVPKVEYPPELSTPIEATRAVTTRVVAGAEVVVVADVSPLPSPAPVASPAMPAAASPAMPAAASPVMPATPTTPVSAVVIEPATRRVYVPPGMAPRQATSVITGVEDELSLKIAQLQIEKEQLMLKVAARKKREARKRDQE